MYYNENNNLDIGKEMGEMNDKQMAQMASRAKMIEGDDQVRAEKCLQEINAILQRYDCRMDPQIVITGNQTMSRVIIQAIKRVKNEDIGASGN